MTKKLARRFLTRNQWKLSAIRIDLSGLSKNKQTNLLKQEKKALKVLGGS